MGPRNLLILFFSTVAFSLVILIIFFSLFFKNVDLNFNTKLPQSAPDIGGLYGNASSTMSPDSKANGLLRSTVNVPPEIAEPARPPEDKKSVEPKDSDLPPVSDDTVLNDASSVGGTADQDGIDETPVAKPTKATAPMPRPAERHTVDSPRDDSNTRQESPPAAPSDNQSGPPVPMQGEARPTTNYKVVMGHYSSREEADAAAVKASQVGAQPIVKQSGERYTVQLGSFSSRQNAESLAGKAGASIVPAQPQ